MIPGDRLSSQVISASFLEPDDREITLLTDWERGGAGISDPSQGLQVRNWRAYLNNGIVVSAENGTGEMIINPPNVTQLSFTFDQNMRPTIAYTSNGTAYFYWYDTVIEDYATTEINGEYPRVALDDKRDGQTTASDIILAYTRSNNLYFRLQRDRYETEYLLGPTEGRLHNMGMNRKNRFQFELRKSLTELTFL